MVEHPAGRETALKPVGTGLGVAHDVEQMLRGGRRQQLAALEACECIDDRGGRGAVVGIVHIPIERGLPNRRRQGVARV